MMKLSFDIRKFSIANLEKDISLRVLCKKLIVESISSGKYPVK